MSEGQELVPISLDQVEQSLVTGEATIPLEDPEVVSRQIIARVLEAGTFEAALQGDSTLPAREVVDVPILLEGVRWMRSALEGGPPVFALLDGTLAESGERVTVTSGAARVMAQLLVACREGNFPYKVVIRESDRPTAQGYKVMRLEQA